MCILQKYITRGLEFIAAKISQSCFLSEASGRETIGGEAERKKERKRSHNHWLILLLLSASLYLFPCAFGDALVTLIREAML